MSNPQQIVSPEAQPAVHNAARDSVLTRGISRIWDAMAQPLIEHVYGPIAERNHMAGVVAVNATLTTPRLAEIPASRRYSNAVREGRRWSARGWLGAKILLKASDGLDGPVARGTGTSTEFGAGWDPAVDLAGSASDTVAIKHIAKDEGDKVVNRLMDVGTAIDVAAIAAGGFFNTLAAKYAKSKGVELSAQEESKSNAAAKAKYAAKGAGNGLLELRATVTNRKVRSFLRGSGIGMHLLSDGLGLVSIFKYGASAMRKVQKVRRATRG